MFNGLMVLELASVLAGPSVGQFFAELGADVIKVENLRTGGDVTRSWKMKGETTDDRSAYFCSVNWGKRSIALDLESAEGQKVISALAARADIVIASYKPGDAEKLGVDYGSLSASNSKIIYGQVTGYGSKNKRVGYDAIIQAEAGFMFMNGEPGGASLKMPVALMDVLAAHQLKEGLLLALIRKERSNVGGLVEVSLIEAAVSSLVNQATNWLVAGKLPQKQGSAHPNIAPYGETFVTKDGKEILLAIGNDRQFVDLCDVLNLQEVAQRSDFINNPARVMNRSALFGLLRDQIQLEDSDIFVQCCNQRNIPVGIIHDLEEVFALPQIQDLILRTADLAGVRTFAGHLDKTPTVANLMPPPHFGEHTVSILQDLYF
jgi:crotonobetainyl-CoA:carnitine CoA-transferase CaiB-like acyl-CoA transferase